MARPTTSPSELLRRLGAPILNVVWSWGAVRPADGVVFLRVWQDRERKVDGKWYTMLTHDAVSSTILRTSAGRSGSDTWR